MFLNYTRNFIEHLRANTDQSVNAVQGNYLYWCSNYFENTNDLCCTMQRFIMLQLVVHLVITGL